MLLCTNASDVWCNMAEEKVFVSFSCQRCLQPLKFDDSLSSLGEHILAELTRKFSKIEGLLLAILIISSADSFKSRCRFGITSN